MRYKHKTDRDYFDVQKYQMAESADEIAQTPLFIRISEIHQRNEHLKEVNNPNVRVVSHSHNPGQKCHLHDEINIFQKFESRLNGVDGDAAEKCGRLKVLDLAPGRKGSQVSETDLTC